MKKRDKYIQKALESLNINYDNSKHEYELNTLKDLDFLISYRKNLIAEMEGHIEDAKSAVEQLKNEVQMAEDLKRQTLVEEYQELNPKRTIL